MISLTAAQLLQNGGEFAVVYRAERCVILCWPCAEPELNQRDCGIFTILFMQNLSCYCLQVEKMRDRVLERCLLLS